MKTTWLERGLLEAAGLVLVYPSLVQDLIGLGSLRWRLRCSICIGDQPPADCQPRIEISPTFCSRPAPENQPADETLQSLSLAVFNTEEFHAHATRPNASDYGRFDIDRMSFVGEGKSHSQDASLGELAFSVKCATAHRNLHDHPLPSDGARGERNRKIRRQTFILAAIFLDSFVCDTPLETLETVAAKLALEGINIE